MLPSSAHSVSQKTKFRLPIKKITNLNGFHCFNGNYIGLYWLKLSNKW